MKQLLRRHARQIAGVTGAALILTLMSMAITGTERVQTLEQAAVSLPSTSPSGIPNGLTPRPSASPSPSASASPSPSPSALPFAEIDALPESATVDQVNTAIGLAIGAILLALVAAGLAGVAIARQPGGDDLPDDDDAPGDGPPNEKPQRA